MIDASMTQMLQALAQKKVSSVELVQIFLDRIQQHAHLNAFIAVCPETALAAAKAADQRRASGGELPLLLGIPIAHKDIFCTAQMPTTCGSKMLSDYQSPYAAHVVDGLEAAGAIVIGKTNMDEFAMGSSNETSFFGPVKNPWDFEKVPGGSSGGSAAAVAARLVPAATGTDTGGSIRQPAALCGVTGLKPSYGVCSRYGMVAFASSLDQAGPIAKSVQECALLLSAMAGFDPRDSTSSSQAGGQYAAGLAQFEQGPKPLDQITIGVPSIFMGEGVDPQVISAVEQAIQTYRKLGARVISVELPDPKLSVAAYYVLATAEASSNLARFDGLRYGHRSSKGDALRDVIINSRSEGFGAEVKRRILTGAYVLSQKYYDAYYRQAQRTRSLIARKIAACFEQCDVILGPTTPNVAFDLGEKSGDPVGMYLSDLFTIFANLAGLPALSMGCGFSRGGLPIGLQLVGQYLKEAQLLGIAHAYQHVTHWHQVNPIDTIS